jgi:hypothetical protein
MASLLDLTKVWMEAVQASVGPDDLQERRTREALYVAAKAVFEAKKEAQPPLVKVAQGWCDMCAVKQSAKALELIPEDDAEDPDDPYDWAVLGAMFLTIQADARLNRVPYGIWTCDEHHEQLALMRATLAEFLKKSAEAAKNPS